MSYCTTMDIISSIGENVLAEMLDVPASTLADNASVTDAIKDAGLRIDSYLVGRYPLPLPVAAESLRVVAVDIAVYYLFRLRRPGDLKDYLARYQEQIAWLEKVRINELDVPEMAASAAADDGVHVIAPPSCIGWGAY
ncbi:DUF1320 domain-containing protein [Thiothrix nivea]|uniref:DUF1320 domain-containing protein n=1 Tax=Thiothrix nivea (strain ATCC 35100 / DSM 5205 / JP2) TaxID=870187 RepID=A0A656HAR4_THINJ|nr:DUF1320 domain-containing protein [Thiothrix nivea]EIJ33323.1 protein of unknown function DUF1320 [Thiothrix nivea DSM 5205]